MLNGTSPSGPDIPHAWFVAVVTTGGEAQASTMGASKLERALDTLQDDMLRFYPCCADRQRPRRY